MMGGQNWDYTEGLDSKNADELGGTQKRMKGKAQVMPRGAESM